MFDDDNSGSLDREETKKFVIETMGPVARDTNFSDEAYDELFKIFDKDNSGTVEKAEMVIFIKQLLGRWNSNQLKTKLLIANYSMIYYLPLV